MSLKIIPILGCVEVNLFTYLYIYDFKERVRIFRTALLANAENRTITNGGGEGFILLLHAIWYSIVLGRSRGDSII